MDFPLSVSQNRETYAVSKLYTQQSFKSSVTQKTYIFMPLTVRLNY